MTHVTNTGDVDLDITVDGGIIPAPAGVTIDVPDDLARRLQPPFEVRRATPAARKHRARKPRGGTAPTAAAVPDPAPSDPGSPSTMTKEA